METLTKTCRVCLRDLPTSEFLGRHAKCNTCRKAAQREYNRAHPEMVRAATRKWQDKNPETVEAIRKRYRANNAGKIYARNKTRRMVYTGKMAKPEACSRCPSAVDIQAHHPDYSKPELVEWLCRNCHETEHHKARKAS